ncbi:MAG: hypothetical protein QXU18_06700 [Thermoplasmatales archaeon]
MSLGIFHTMIGKDENPWKEFAIKVAKGETGPYVLSGEDHLIKKKNDKIKKEEEKFKLHLIPEPFAGNPDAPIYLLNQNPRPVPYSDIKDNDQMAIIKKRLKCHNLYNLVFYDDCLGGNGIGEPCGLKNLNDFKKFPFYHLDPYYKHLPNFVWWYRNLSEIIQNVRNDLSKDKKIAESDVLQIVSNSIFDVELVPYHSQHFIDVSGLESQEYAIELVERAIKDEKIIIVMKGYDKYWKEKVTDPKSEKVYRLKSRNSKISQGNIENTKGDKTEEQISDKNSEGKKIMEEITDKISSYWHDMVS